MERFYLHMACGTDLAISAPVNPATATRPRVLIELKRALLARHGRVAQDMEIREFTWCRGCV